MDHLSISELMFPTLLPLPPRQSRTSTELVECSVVVPVYNSAECLAELSRRIDAAFAKLNVTYEVLLVNDGSADRSWPVIQDLAARRTNIRGLSFRKNFGQDNALMAGLRHARGRYVVMMDDDLQHDPADIVPLYRKIATGLDVVYANYNDGKRQKFWKNAGSWLNGKAAELVLHKPREVYLSPFKIVARPLVDEVCRYEGAYPCVDGLIFRTTARIGQIRVAHHERYQGQSNYTFWRSLLVWSHLATNFSVLPLRLATCAGLASSMTGFALVLFFVIRYFLSGALPGGATSALVSIQILGGFQLFALGIAGEYIGKTFLSINRHPQYAISETTAKLPVAPGRARI